MKRLLAFCLAALSSFTSLAQAPQPPEIAARQYLLVDLTSQQVLAERDADAQADPASLTKLMTAYLVFAAIRDKKLSLEQTLAGQESLNGHHVIPSSEYLVPGTASRYCTRGRERWRVASRA